MNDATQEDRESRELHERLQMGLRLFKNKVRFHHWAPGSGLPCTTLHCNGDVEIEGVAGRFAPNLLEIDGEVESVPLLGSVN